jgi:hypothetical protein
MTYEKFDRIVTTIKDNSEAIQELYQRNVDLINFVDPYESLVAELIKEIYGKEGYDWFSWFVYEIDESNVSKENPRAWDKDKNPICYDRKSMWEYLETNKGSE